jgi:hypothetical protein
LFVFVVPTRPRPLDFQTLHFLLLLIGPC